MDPRGKGISLLVHPIQSQKATKDPMSLPPTASVNFQFVCDPSEHYETPEQPLLTAESTALHKMGTALMLGSFQSLMEHTPGYTSQAPRIYANMCGLGVPVYTSQVESLQLQQLHTDCNRIDNPDDCNMAAHTVISTCELSRSVLVVVGSHKCDYSSAEVGFNPTEQRALVEKSSLLEQLKHDIEQKGNAKIVKIPPWSNFYMNQHLIHAGMPHSIDDFDKETERPHLLNEHRSMMERYNQLILQNNNLSQNDFINPDRNKDMEQDTPFATAYFSHFSLLPNAPDRLGAAFPLSGSTSGSKKGLPFLTRDGFKWFDDEDENTKLWMNPKEFNKLYKK